jgi:hypothetical protein
MEAEMRFFGTTVLLMICFASPSARAEAVQVGRGVMCDTIDQVKRFVALRSDGKEPQVALNAINKDAGDGAACNFGVVMFSGEESITELSVNGRPVSILRIVVHAVGNGSAWRQVPQTVRYTPMPEKGQMI